MAQLIVRNVDEEVAAALRRRAADRGRSAEAEHRDILRRALLEDGGFKKALLSMPVDLGDESIFDRVRDLGRDVEL